VEKSVADSPVQALPGCDFDGGSKTSGSLRSALEVYVIRSRS